MNTEPTSAKDEDQIIDEIDDDPILKGLREQRLDELKHQMLETERLKQMKHGVYTEISTEKEFLKLTTESNKVIIHFFHKDFRRCDILDKHFKIIANRHFETKIAKVNVETAPFFVEKLGVRVIPCIISFLAGIAVDRVVGFDELGGTDGFSTELLEKRLSKTGVIKVENKTEIAKKKTTIMGARVEQQSDSDDD